MAALLRGRRGLGVAAALNPVMFLAGIAELLTSNVGSVGSVGRTCATLALCALPAIAGVLGFPRDTARVAHPRLWFAAIVLVGFASFAQDYANNRPVGSAWAVSSNVFAIGCACIAVGVAVSRARRSAVWPVALLVTGAPLLLMIPTAMTALSYAAGVSLHNTLSIPGSMDAYVGLYALGAEVLLALTTLAALVRRTKIAPATSAP
jgi:hypothetical protein